MIDYCEKIRSSIEVNVPATVANEEWTQFVFSTLYMPRHDRSARDADPGEGFVRLEAVGEGRTKVTVDLNYGPQWKDIEDDTEIDEARRHLDWVLGRYKEFVERGSVKTGEADR